jgi:hypothetical protein
MASPNDSEIVRIAVDYQTVLVIPNSKLHDAPSFYRNSDLSHSYTNSSQSEGRILIVTKRKRIETMPSTPAEMVKRIANLKDVRILHTGDDWVKALVGAVTGKSNGAAVPAPAPEKTNTADL